MARSRESKIELTAYDDLFQTDESREEAKLSKIRDIPIAEIDEFPDHPFKVLMDEDMEQLVDSIKRNGVMTPATVRVKEDGRYELISGHRRKKACELAGLDTLKCEVKELTRDEAIIVMVESNLQRSTILPSEKAFAYKMRLEAMKRQGQRTDLTSAPMVQKLTSREKIAAKSEESHEQVRRFIRLTELVPEILQMVDDRQIAFRPAVEISYLSEEQQYTLLEAMQYPHEPNGIQDPEYSIQCGVQELKAALISAEVENPIDMEHIKLALQGYNFGNGYISWAKTNYGGYSYANAVEFSTMQAQRLGWESYSRFNLAEVDRWKM